MSFLFLCSKAGVPLAKRFAIFRYHLRDSEILVNVTHHKNLKADLKSHCKNQFQALVLDQQRIRLRRKSQRCWREIRSDVHTILLIINRAYVTIPQCFLEKFTENLRQNYYYIQQYIKT